MRRLFWLLGFICLTLACTEEIDWDVQDGEPRLVVEGAVTNELKKHYVKIGMSQGSFEERANTGISHAKVTVYDGERNFFFEEDPENTGYYQSMEPFAGEVGRTYDLDIELPEPINGIQHLQASARMSHRLEFDSIQVKRETFLNEEAFTVRVFGQKPTEPFNYYLIQVYSNGQMLTGEFTDMILLSNDDLEDFQINDIAIYRNEDIQEGDNITLKVQSLTKDYHTFLSNALNAIQGNGMIGISGPPANAIGNLGDEVMGYFYAAPASTVSAVAIADN